MLIGFLDDTEIKVDPEDTAPDIFAFGGYFIRLDQLEDFQRRIRGIKSRHELLPHAPVKWNMRDSSLIQFYNRERWLNENEPKHLLEISDAIRRDLLSLLCEFDARILISARYDSHWREATHGEYFSWAFENLLQRVGLMCQRLETAQNGNASAMIVVDWPQGGVDKSLFDIYMGGYYYGHGFATRQKYFSGNLSQYRFLDSLTHGSTLHSGPLQIADLVVGCCRDFLTWAYKGTKPNKIRGMFDLLIDQFDRNERGEVNDCGFKVAKDNRIDIQKKINEYLDWARLAEMPF